MAQKLLTVLSVLILLSASLYQFILKDLIFVAFSFGRKVQSIEDFPYHCRRLQHERLEGCEDLWFDIEQRILYAACSGLRHRFEWSQATGKFNLSGRRPGGGELIALNVDSPGDDGLYGMRAVKAKGYVGPAGDNSLDLVGFDAEIMGTDTIHFYLINQRAPLEYPSDPASKIAQNTQELGANSTIEVFELKRGRYEMSHLRTIHSDAVWSPNRVAILGNGAFTVSNDHSVRVGFRKHLDPFIGGGNVAYCSKSGTCHAATGSLKFPNGLTKGQDGLVYVPSSIDGGIRVYRLDITTSRLEQVEVIETGLPIDNLAVDANGDMFVPGFPDFARTIKHLSNPFEFDSPTTVLRIRKTPDGYKVDKIIEDSNGSILSGVTTTVHDAKTGKLWMGSAHSPFMAVCDPE